MVGASFSTYYFVNSEYWWISFKKGVDWHYYSFHAGRTILILTGIGALLIYILHRKIKNIIMWPIKKATKLVGKIRGINYQYILIIWCAIGILIGGYYYIFPERYSADVSWDNALQSVVLLEESKRYGEVVLLITVVGAILIFGFGRMNEKKKPKGNAD